MEGYGGGVVVWWSGRVESRLGVMEAAAGVDARPAQWLLLTNKIEWPP